MFIKLLQKSPFIQRIRYPVGIIIAQPKFDEIKEFIKKDDSIIEIGAGTGDIVELLKKNGYKKVTPVDVVDLSFIPSVKPIIYSGKIPFGDNKFDAALLITVLHHCKNPTEVLKDAARVAKKVIIVEETYENNFQKYSTFIWDSITNLEFFNHPHSNKTDNEWQSVFKKLGLKIIKSRIKKSGILTRATYFLEK